MASEEFEGQEEWRDVEEGEIPDLLLDLIQNYPYLYDKQNKDYKNNLKKIQAWNEMGLILNLSDGEIKLESFLNHSVDPAQQQACNGPFHCKLGSNGRSLELTAKRGGFNILASTTNSNEYIQYSANLSTKDTHWFGGPELKKQNWPLEKTIISKNDAYVPIQHSNAGVTERYWLSSKGVFIFIDDQTPLFVDQNSDTKGVVYFISKLQEPYIQSEKNLLNVTLTVKNNAKEAHLEAVNNFLGKPSRHPNEKMVKEPVWTTWAKYKKVINDSSILEFANEIRRHNYTSGGQLEIDDNWETCYGNQEFDLTKFGNISETLKTIKNMGFRIALWIHPFVDDNCKERTAEAQSKGFFVKSLNGSDKAAWWNSKHSHEIDFTNPKAVSWFSKRVEALHTDFGIDSFKFDAGEVSYTDQPSIYPHANKSLWPAVFTHDYIKAVSQFGNLIEYRTAWRNQDLPNFVRLVDKTSGWGLSNGLSALITSMLTLNMVGYGMVLPDIIGGNGYQNLLPSAELLVRWAQVNTFMPAMQLGYVPWDYQNATFDVERLVKKCVDLHAEYTPYILKAMKNNIQTGAPVNPPIWWLDPTDEKALPIYDEFLVGEDILVAPIIREKATERSVYLPKGTWKDGNNGNVYTGPVSISYDAPIDVLPFFLRTSA